MRCDELGHHDAILIRDGDRKFTTQFDHILEKQNGIRVNVLPRHSPNLNTFAERWIWSINHECLNHMLCFGVSQLQYIVERYGWKQERKTGSASSGTKPCCGTKGVEGDHKEPTETVIHIPKQFLRTFDDDLLAAGIAKRVPVDAHGRPIPIVQGKPVATPAKWIIDKRDPHGRVVDLHALRHTFGTRLVASGVDIKTTQSLMRHSTASLTLSIYVHKDSQRMAAAVAALPEINHSTAIFPTRNH